VFPTGRKGLKTIDENRKQPSDDPWKFWDEATSEEKRLEGAELDIRGTFHPEEGVPFRMMPSGPRSCLRAGNWMISTRKQNNGTTIEVKYDPVSNLLGDQSRLADDAKRLGLRYTHNARGYYIAEQAKQMAVSNILVCYVLLFVYFWNQILTLLLMTALQNLHKRCQMIWLGCARCESNQ
jgi:hypothetical protein